MICRMNEVWLRRLRRLEELPGPVWVFGAYVAQFETYIKFAIYVIQGTVKSICVSFHEAERPLSYPYRKAS